MPIAVALGGLFALILVAGWCFRQRQQVMLLQRQLREYRDLFTQAFTQNADPMCISRLDGTLVAVNPVFIELSGYTEEELLGATTLSLHLWQRVEDRAALFELLEQQDALSSHPMEFRRKSGAVMPSLLSVSRIVYGDKPCLLSHIRDLTPLKALEARQRQLERQLLSARNLEAMGTLVAGIARRFNNRLAAIIGYAELALDDIDAQGQTANDLERILGQSRTAQQLVDQLLAFGQGRQYRKEPIDLLTVLDGLRSELLMLAGDSYQVESRSEGRAALVLADVASLHLALLNICRNALEAMPLGGKVVLGLQSPSGSGASFGDIDAGLPAGEFVHFFVKDQGCGIDPVNLDRIFHPFFSTKPSVQGTGMGLSVTHGIIRDHGGHIRVNSCKGLGTTVHLFLPLISGEQHAPTA